MTGPLGHNGGPALEEPADTRPHTRPGQCNHCRHWKAPCEGEKQAYEAFRIGVSRRRVRPCGDPPAPATAS